MNLALPRRSSLLSGARAILREKYSHLGPRLLDNVIWNLERRPT
jgi:hypothetical protein